MNRPLPLFFCVDVEPDAFLVDRARPDNWSGTTKTFTFIRRLREEWLRETGAPLRVSWFVRMDPQVETAYGSLRWGVDRFESQLREVASHGDEIGLHVHAYRWSGAHRTWLVDHDNPEWIEECINRGFEAFEEAFGRPCRIFRFGDRFMSTEAMNLLERLGVIADLTVEPGEPALRSYHDEAPATGQLPDYADAPLGWYRPDAGNFLARTVAPRGIVEIPLSTRVLTVPWSGMRGLGYRMLRPSYFRPFNWRFNLSQHPLVVQTVLERMLGDTSTTHVMSVFRSALPRPSNVAAGSQLLMAAARSGRLQSTTPERWLGQLPRTHDRIEEEVAAQRGVRVA